MKKMTESKPYEHYAAIDIGSNAVRLLIKRIGTNEEGLYCSKEQLVRVPLRLGFDVFTKGRISKKKAKNLVRLMKSFAYLMKIYDVAEYKACATAAIRDALNGKDLIARVRKKTGLRIHILSGQEEAKIIYGNHAECIQDRKGNFMYVDVGGGSTEINMLVDGNLVSSYSYNIGTIRVLSGTTEAEEWNRLKLDVNRLALAYPGIEIIGSGGNINKLYRLVDKPDKQHQRITVKSLAEIHQVMSHLTLEERVKRFKLRYDRADVIVPAAYIFLSVAAFCKANYIYVPTIGLVDGIIDELFTQKIDELQMNLDTQMVNPLDGIVDVEDDRQELEEDDNISEIENMEQDSISEASAGEDNCLDDEENPATWIDEDLEPEVSADERMKR